MIQTGIIGNHAEKMALKFLKKKKLRFIENNYRCRRGEIDLIMQDGDCLVFIEVRYRRDQRFGGALESIDSRKQGKLRATAELYLQQHKKTDTECRFDILCIDGKLSNPTYNWIRNAF